LFHTQAGESVLTLPGYLNSDRERLAAAAVLAALAVVVLWSLKRSTWGLRFAAVKSGPVMAEHFGVSAPQARVYAFIVSGGLAGAAGVMYAALLEGVTPASFDVGLSLEVLLYTVSGGVTVLFGAFLSTAGFQAIPQLLGLAKYGASAWPDLIGGIGTVGLLSSAADGMVSTTRRPQRSGKKATQGLEVLAGKSPANVAAAAVASTVAAGVDGGAKEASRR
jgi:branched-chain amino acid transport system permease protein